MNKFFPEIKKKLAFGFMRLPMIGTEVDEAQCEKMVDEFLANGFNYFDTAHIYIQGKSEKVLKKCLTSRYPREAYLVADKLSSPNFEKEEDVRRVFQEELDACGVEYFDFFLMHSQGSYNYPKFKKCRAYEQAFELKAEGKIRHVGFSFHDSPELLEQILTDYPQVEFVQLQFNYADYEDKEVQSRACYEVCKRHGKPVMVMEPVKGGNLAHLPEAANEIFKAAGEASPASYAVRFAAGHENVAVVLSGMSSIEQVKDNVSFMKDFKPLSDEEQETIEKVLEVINSQRQIKCTGCRYCVDGCPKKIAIPDVFEVYNSYLRYEGWRSQAHYGFVVKDKGRAGDCIKCGKCEKTCPQKLPIRELLAEISSKLD